MIPAFKHLLFKSLMYCTFFALQTCVFYCLQDDIEILELYQQEPLSDGDDTLANTRLPSLEKDSDGHVDSPLRQGK